MADNPRELRDTISSKEGTAFITINGSTREMFDISSITAQLEYTVQSRRMLGSRMMQHKIVGAEGTGSMTMYFMNSDMLRMAQAYIKDGSYGGISIKIKNFDSQSTVGTQEVILRNVLLNTIPVATLDDQSDDPITVDTDFTFDSIDGLSYFDLPANYR